MGYYNSIRFLSKIAKNFTSVCEIFCTVFEKGRRQQKRNNHRIHSFLEITNVYGTSCVPCLVGTCKFDSLLVLLLFSYKAGIKKIHPCCLYILMNHEGNMNLEQKN